MIRKTVVVLLATIVTLFCAEIFLRLYDPFWMAGSIHAYRYDPELGITLKRNIHDLRTTDYQEETLTNALGSANFQQSFKEYRHLVFAVGDSYTEGTGLPADAGYPFQLDMMLNLSGNAYRHDYGVVNLGVASFGGRQNIIRLQRFIKRVGRPDYILYLASDNDASDDRLFAEGYRNRHLVDGSPYWGIWEKPLQWLAHDTEIGKRMLLLAERFRRQAYAAKARHGAGIRHVPNGRRISVAEQEAGVFRSLQKIAQENRARLIVGWSALPDERDGSYAWLKQWAAEHDAGFIDWHPAEQSMVRAIPSLPPHNPNSGGHYRSWVQHLIARSCAQLIRAEPPCSPASGKSCGPAAAPAGH